VAHGAPPFEVRYEGRQDHLDLSITDAGSGLPEGAEERAQRSGRMGLLVMRQRAETMGGRLEVSSPSPSGTRVRLL
jgi:signal transduction histidine kinase